MLESANHHTALLIVNPISGKMLAKNKLFELLDNLTKEHVLPSVYITQKSLDAKNIASKFAGRYPLVICCGGDGTLNEVISGIIEGGHHTPIGYIPAGTTNDYANSLEIPKDFAAAVANAVHGKPTVQDVGVFGDDKHFSYIASFGMLSSVSYSTPQILKNLFGHLAYIMHGITNLSDIKSYHIEIEADGFLSIGDYLFGAVTNSTSIAGIFKLSPEQVDLHDGQYEAIFIRTPTNLAEFNLLLNCLTTQNPDPKLFDCFRTSKLKVHCAKPIAWTTDGEFAGEMTDAYIRNLPNAAAIMLPRNRF